MPSLEYNQQGMKTRRGCVTPAGLRGDRRAARAPVDLRSLRARSRRPHRSSPVPPPLAVDQRVLAADRPAARAPGADRVLGLLPAQLAAFAAIRELLARAVRVGRPALDRGARLGV